MTHRKQILCALAFLLMGVVSAPAQAATITTSGNAASSINLGDIVSGGGSAHATVSNVTLTPAPAPQASATAKAAVAANAPTIALPAVALSISRHEVNASTTKTLAKSAASKDSLRAYVLGVMNDQKRLKSVEFATTSVSMAYLEPAKLFGFIPMQMTAHASVDAAGNVAITYPWYKSFVKALNTENIRTDIEAHTKLMLSHVHADVSAPLTVREQAELFDQLRVALENNADIAAGVGQ